MTTATPPLRQRTSEPATKPEHHWGTDALLVLMAVIWGVNYIVVKLGTGFMTPLAFNGARVAIAAVVLAAIVAATRRAWPGGRDLLVLLALGALGNGLYQFFFIEGLARTRAGTTALILAAAPAFMAIIGRILGVERATGRKVLGILASLLGIALVVFGTTQPHGAETSAVGSTLAGAMLVLAACLCWSLYTVLLKPYTERIEGLTLSAVTMVGGAVPLLAVASGEVAHTSWGSLTLGAWGALAYSGLLALALAYLFWYRGVRVLGPTRTAMYSNLQPVIALLVAWPALGEVPTVVQIAGAVAIMFGILLTRA